ncbi:uncharacterized protein AKAME5_000748600 [Lates japonicus]|uniref:Uncharacterized protein n=1 Tax=Lates japonicus TaxID=270547 RepID=A0AAD3MJI1_LATJO|nr:uncharacterized protein AKAME5_000748600 [Lates japonicus]
MDSAGGSRESAAENSESPRREAPSSGGRSELLMYLTCLPERYRNAKFSLAAYLLCWALFRWYQKLRCQSAPLQNERGVKSGSQWSSDTTPHNSNRTVGAVWTCRCSAR